MANQANQSPSPTRRDTRWSESRVKFCDYMEADMWPKQDTISGAPDLAGFYMDMDNAGWLQLTDADLEKLSRVGFVSSTESCCPALTNGWCHGEVYFHPDHWRLAEENEYSNEGVIGLYDTGLIPLSETALALGESMGLL